MPGPSGDEGARVPEVPEVPEAGAGERVRPEVSRFAGNTLILFLSYGLNTLLSAVVAIFLVRYLGKAEYGVLTTIFAYLSFFSTLISAGVDTVVTRDVARDPERAGEIAGEAMGLRLVLAGVGMVAAWALLPLIDPTPRLATLVVVASLTFPVSFYGLYLVLYSVQLRQGKPKLVFAVWSILYSGARLGLIALAAPLWAFVVAEVVSSGVIFLLARELGRRIGFRPVVRIDRDAALRLLRKAWPVGLTVALIQVYLRIDQVMLYRFMSEAEVGLYAVPVRLTEFTVVIPTVFMGSAFPILSRLWVESGERHGEATRMSFRAMSLVGFPVAAYLFYYAEPVLVLLFGTEFAESAATMRLLAWSLPFYFTNSVLYNQLFSAGRQRHAAALAGVAALLNVVLNVPLILEMGKEGAAIATLVSYGCVAALAVAPPTCRDVGRAALESWLRPGLAIAAGLAAASFLAPGPVVAGIVLGGTYLALVVLTGEVGRREVDLLLRATGRK